MPKMQNAQARGLVNVKRRRDCGFKESAGSTSQSCIPRVAQHRPQGPQRAAMAVFRSNIFLPFAVVAEKVPEPASLVVEGKP